MHEAMPEDIEEGASTCSEEPSQSVRSVKYIQSLILCLFQCVGMVNGVFEGPGYGTTHHEMIEGDAGENIIQSEILIDHGDAEGFMRPTLIPFVAPNGSDIYM